MEPNTELKITGVPHCDHCGSKMRRMEVPPLAQFDAPYIYVCFNDECEYFQRGWQWMLTRYASKTSYRFKVDPFTGEKGPLPVWSEDALKDNIMDEEE